MPMKPPAWIDNEYIRKSIQDGDENKVIVVRSLDISPAVPAGNNYGSSLWRVKVKYQENTTENIQDLSLIVKAPHEDEGLKDIFDPFSQVEPSFYNRLLPILHNNNFAPKHFYSAIPGAIVMEDLSAQGYQMGDRLKGLDYDECRLYAVASATFHAATVAAHKKDPELIESLGREKMFTDERNEFAKGLKRFLFISVCISADKMENMNEFKKYAGLVRSTAATVWDDLVEAHKRSTTLNALGHGDSWTTNMMFKYDSSGKAVEMKLLDFQAVRYSSPIADLVYFVWISARHEVREDHLEDLYHLYCTTLNDKLQEFNCSERLPYEQLLATIKRFCSISIYMVASFNPFSKCAESFDFCEVMKKAVDEKATNKSLFDMLSRYYTKAYCEEELPKSLKQLQATGFFDYLKHSRSSREVDKELIQK